MTKFPMKQIAGALLLSGACMTTQAASTTTNLGTLDIGATPFFGAILKADPLDPAVVFGDFFTFNLPANGGSAYSVVDFPIASLGLGTSFTSLTLWSMGPDNSTGGADNVLLATGSGTGSNISLNFGATPSTDNLFLAVTGFTTGANGGLYSGAISVSPVPEPEVWAMMLVGVGLVGFRLRHRSKRESAARFA
jgi:hypothetical protein